MAKNEAVDADADAVAVAPAKSGNKNMLFLIIGAVLLMVVSMGGSYFMMKSLVVQAVPQEQADEEGEVDAEKSDKKKGDKKSSKKKEEPKVAIYMPVEPAFVVNFENQYGVRFLQVSMEFMGNDALQMEDVKKHMPYIRNNLVILLSSQKYEDIISRDGKEKIRAAALAEVQKIMTEQTGKPVLQAVYFTNFVMQ